MYGQHGKQYMWFTNYVTEMSNVRHNYSKCFQSPKEASEEIYKYIHADILLKTANLIFDLWD